MKKALPKILLAVITAGLSVWLFNLIRSRNKAATAAAAAPSTVFPSTVDLSPMDLGDSSTTATAASSWPTWSEIQYAMNLDKVSNYEGGPFFKTTKGVMAAAAVLSGFNKVLDRIGPNIRTLPTSGTSTHIAQVAQNNKDLAVLIAGRPTGTTLATLAGVKAVMPSETVTKP